MEPLEAAEGRRAWEGGEEVLLRVEGAVLDGPGGASAAGAGTVYVTSRRIAWEGRGGGGGWWAPLQRVVMHSVWRGDGAPGRADSLYCQLEEAGGGAALLEAWVTPADAADVDALFKAMCSAAEMCPDEGGAGAGQGVDGEDDGGLALMAAFMGGGLAADGFYSPPRAQGLGAGAGADEESSPSAAPPHAPGQFDDP